MGALHVIHNNTVVLFNVVLLYFNVRKKYALITYELYLGDSIG